MTTKRIITIDERSIIVNALELHWASVKRAVNASKNPKLTAVLEEQLTEINNLQRDLNNLELF